MSKETEQAAPYIITVIQDYDVQATFYFESALIAVETWHKFNDYGDAEHIRLIHLTTSSGEHHTKEFRAK